MKADNSREYSILTLGGMLVFSRYYLRPANQHSKQLFRELYGKSGIAPLDVYFGIDLIPFRISCEAALKICRTALDSSSLMDAERKIQNLFHVHVSDDNIRKIVLCIGSIVQAGQIEKAKKVTANYNAGSIHAGKMRGRPASDAFHLYMEAALISESTYVCCTYTVSCASQSVSLRHLMYSRCTIDEFKSVMVAQALYEGLNAAREMIVLTDGTDEITAACKEVFPFATFILNKRFLQKYFSTFAERLVKSQINTAYRADYFIRYALIYIEAGETEKIFNMREMENKKGLRAKQHAIDEIQHFLDSKKDLLQYPAFKANDYLIGNDLPAEEQILFEEGKLATVGNMWTAESAVFYLPLYAMYISGEWRTDIVPLVRERYNGWRKNLIFMEQESAGQPSAVTRRQTKQ